jgi:hypothetical protein
VIGHLSADLTDAMYEKHRLLVENELIRLGSKKDQIQFAIGQADTLGIKLGCHFTVELRSEGFQNISSAFNGVSKKEGLFTKEKMPVGASFSQGEQQLKAKNRFYWVNIQEIQQSRPKKIEEIKGLVIRDYQAQQEQKWIEACERSTRWKFMKNGWKLLQNNEVV